MYVKRIKLEARLEREKRTTTSFDNNFLISIFRSLNEKAYDKVIEIMSQKR